jgi:hypothetical protein
VEKFEPGENIALSRAKREHFCRLTVRRRLQAWELFSFP